MKDNNEIVAEETIAEEAAEEAAEEVAIEKPYTLRSLQDGDLFPMLDIITAVLPESDGLETIFAQVVKKEKSVEDIGAVAVYKIVISVLKNISKVHDELYSLLSDLSNIPAEEIPKMAFGTTPMMIWDVVADAKNANFFKVLSKLL